MLQRIQTIFLLLIVILTAILFFVPFQTIISGDEQLSITLYGPHTANVNSLIFLLISLGLILLTITFATIFLYKKRTLQMKLCSLLAVLSCLLCVVMVSPIYSEVTQDKPLSVNYNFYAFLPALNIILAFIAKRFIKNDEELVRSADRIR
jgi:ABC-type uncharacterized transport system permease subunit